MRAVKCRPKPNGLGRSAGADCITGSTRILKPFKHSPEENGRLTISIRLQARSSGRFFRHDDTNSRHWQGRLLCGANVHGPARTPGRPRAPARLHAHGPNCLCADTTTLPARGSIPLVERPGMWSEKIPEGPLFLQPKADIMNQWRVLPSEKTDGRPKAPILPSP